MDNKIAIADVDNYGTCEEFTSYLGKFYKRPRSIISGNGLHPICHVYNDGRLCVGDFGNWSLDFTVNTVGEPMTDQDILDILMRVFTSNRLENFELYLRSCHEYVQNLWRTSGEPVDEETTT